MSALCLHGCATRGGGLLVRLKCGNTRTRARAHVVWANLIKSLANAIIAKCQTYNDAIGMGWRTGRVNSASLDGAYKLHKYARAAQNAGMIGDIER